MPPARVYHGSLHGAETSFQLTLALTLLSHNTNYTRAITPHSYENDYGVETAIRVCIQITQQCNQAFSGMTQCGEYSIGIVQYNLHCPLLVGESIYAQLHEIYIIWIHISV